MKRGNQIGGGVVFHSESLGSVKLSLFWVLDIWLPEALSSIKIIKIFDDCVGIKKL